MSPRTRLVHLVAWAAAANLGLLALAAALAGAGATAAARGFLALCGLG